MSKTAPSPGNGCLDGNGVSMYGARADHTHDGYALADHTHDGYALADHVHDGMVICYKVEIAVADWDEDGKAVKTVAGLKDGYFACQVATGITVTRDGEEVTFTATDVPTEKVTAYIING